MLIRVTLLAYAMTLTAPAFSAGDQAKTGCEGAGPQAPRDIAAKAGANGSIFNYAPNVDKLNLCNIHFHKNAEHKAPGFSQSAGTGTYGGWQCNSASSLTANERKPFTGKASCTNIKVGDTVEIHWVHSSCQVKPGPGLGSCLSKTCGNPQLRVEARTFVLVNDRSAMQLTKYDAAIGHHRFWQAKNIPETGPKVQYTGSTTGPKYSGKNCSPLQVSWSVGSSCGKMDIASVHKWCAKNRFKEDHAHGVRMIVKNENLLSPIR